MEAVAITPESEESSTLTYKQREIAKVERFAKSLARLDSVAAKVNMPAGQRELIANAGEACTQLLNKLFSKMPDTFTPPAASQAVHFEKGQTVSPSEEFAELYSKLDNEVTVRDVVRMGGNEQGKGARIFLKVKRSDGSLVTVPAAHFE